MVCFWYSILYVPHKDQHILFGDIKLCYHNRFEVCLA